MIIDLIRHTTPDVDSGICYGQSDLDLVHGYEQEFAQVQQKIHPYGNTEPYDLLVSSPLQRCSKLASTLKAKQSKFDDRIMEYNFGDWELKPWAEIKDEDSRQWMKNFVDQPAPNGDSILIMQQRVIEFWQELIQSQYQSVAVVTHSGVQRLIHAHILATPLHLMFRVQLEFGAIIRCQHDAKTELTTVKHL